MMYVVSLYFCRQRRENKVEGTVAIELGRASLRFYAKYGVWKRTTWLELGLPC